MANARAAWDRFARSDLAVPALLVAVRVAVYFLVPEPSGYFRDELYYLACADHLDFGYVDHPPFSIALLALVRAAFGVSLVALRIVPLAAMCAGSIVTALLARALGGGRFAVALAALAALVAPVYLAHSSNYSMNALDVLLHALALLALARAMTNDGGRWWIAFGAIVGLGVQNKPNFALLGVATAIGIVATNRKALRDRNLWLGAALAAAITLPYLVWQVAHDWPLFEFSRNARAMKMTGFAPLDFLGSQILIMGPVSFPLWLAGLAFLAFAKSMARFRIFAIVFALMLGANLAMGGKSYYLAPAYPILLAAGALALDRLPQTRAGNGLRRAVFALVLISGVALAPIAMPMLPPGVYVRYASVLGVAPPRDERRAIAALPQIFADRFGWEDQVATVARVFESLPAAERPHVAILAGNYGEAGAIDFWRAKYGLPRAISTHNSYWLWGPGAATGEVVIAFGIDRASLDAAFESVEEAARIVSPWALPDETDLPVYVCRGLREPIDALWAKSKKFI